MPPRSRKRGGSMGVATRANVSRSEARNAAIRATLTPYEPGERPVPVTIAVGVAAVLALANLVLMASGWKIHGQGNPVLGGLLFAGLMLGAAAGMWRMRYWAVLGFEAVLGVAIVVFALFLVRASNVLAVAVCLAVMGFGGWLFWKLVRVMSRMQAPAR